MVIHFTNTLISPCKLCYIILYFVILYILFSRAEKQHSLKSIEISSLTENQVSHNCQISSSASKIGDQQVSLIEEMQCTQTENSTPDPWACNDCKERFSTWETLCDHMVSSDHLKIAINDNQTQQILPSTPICMSNFPSFKRYECENCTLKFYSSHDFENHNCEQINSQNLSSKPEQGNCNANFNLELLSMETNYTSQFENNHVPNTDHTSENNQTTAHTIQNYNQNNFLYKDLAAKVNSCDLEFDKDSISVQKVTACNDNTNAFISSNERDKYSMKPYWCPLCSKGFIRKILLSNHIKSHYIKKTPGSQKGIPKFNQVDGIYEKQNQENNIHKCSLCNKTFNFKQALTRHFSMHEKCFPVDCFKCLRCQEVFPFEQHVRSHILDGCTAQIFSECGNNLGQYEEIKIYMFLICEYCIKGFETVDELNNHRKTHKGQHLFFCTLCKKKFKSYWKLRCHQRSHNYSEEYKQFLELRRVFICQFCAKGVSSYSAFKQHISQHQVKRKVNRHVYKTLKSPNTKKNFSKCIQEIKRRKSLRNKVVRSVTESSITTKGAKEKKSKEILIDIISEKDNETKESFIDQAEESLNIQELITIYPSNYLQEEINNNQSKEIFNQEAITNDIPKHNNETKECSDDREQYILSCHLSNKQKIETTYPSNQLQAENSNQNNENFHEREQISYTCNVKQPEPTNIVKDHPRRRLHDCTFCSKRFKKACNLARHVKGKHT